MKNPMEYKKGPMGHMLDLRKNFGEMAICTREWCRAFDAGDMSALTDLGEEMKNCMGRVVTSTKAIAKWES